MKKLAAVFLLLSLLLSISTAVLAAPPEQAALCAETVIVQANDWLSKLADKYYGDLLAYPAIVAATNQANAVDGSFAHVASADLIEPGWKLCIIDPTEAQTLLSVETESHTTYPLTLTDGLGRVVTLETAPQRIVSLTPSNTETLFALGLGDRVVGVTKFDTYPPEAQEKEIIGGTTARSISLEAILALEPDLVLAGDERQQPVIEALETNDIPVFAVDATGLADVYRAFDWIGQLADAQPEAVDLKQQLQSDLAVLSEQIEQIPVEQRPTVFYEVWDQPLMTAGPETFIGQLISLAGATNTFADVTEDFPEISPEVLIARNPAVILGPRSHTEALTADVVAARPGWGEIEAVRTGRVYLLDGDLISRPGPRLGLALRAIVEALYPDVFKPQ